MMVSLYRLIVILLLMLCCCSYCLHLPKSQWKKRERRMTSSSVESSQWKKRERRMTSSSVESLSILSSAENVDYFLESIKALGPGALPLAAVALYTVSVNNQIGIIEKTTNTEIKSAKEALAVQVNITKDQIKANKEESDKQIKANKEESDKQISVMKELVNIQINAMNKISEQTTKASESKIESILMRFTAQNYNRSGEN